MATGELEGLGRSDSSLLRLSSSLSGGPLSLHRSGSEGQETIHHLLELKQEDAARSQEEMLEQLPTVNARFRQEKMQRRDETNACRSRENR